MAVAAALFLPTTLDVAEDSVSWTFCTVHVDRKVRLSFVRHPSVRVQNSSTVVFVASHTAMDRLSVLGTFFRNECRSNPAIFLRQTCVEAASKGTMSDGNDRVGMDLPGPGGGSPFQPISLPCFIDIFTPSIEIVSREDSPVPDGGGSIRYLSTIRSMVYNDHRDHIDQRSGTGGTKGSPNPCRSKRLVGLPRSWPRNRTVAIVKKDQTTSIASALHPRGRGCTRLPWPRLYKARCPQVQRISQND